MMIKIDAALTALYAGDSVRIKGVDHAYIKLVNTSDFTGTPSFALETYIGYHRPKSPNPRPVPWLPSPEQLVAEVFEIIV